MKIAKIALAAAVLLLGAFFIPEYHPTPSPVSPAASDVMSGGAQQTARAEIAALSPSAPLSLLTEPDDGMGAVRAAIATASTSLDLVIYELEDARIEQALASAEARGVAVRVILQNVNTFGRHPNQPAFDFLKAHAVSVAWANSNFALTHQKTLVVDADGGAASAWALIMTFNLASQYYATARDFALADRDPQDVAAIEKTFNNDWGGGQAVADNARDLVWSPGSAPTLLSLIDAASATLDIYNEEMADPRITTALERAAVRGVRVRVVMTYATNWKQAFNELTAAGAAVRTFSSSGKFYIHAKMILADADATASTSGATSTRSGTRAFLGSENFSGPSLDANRELGLLITRPDILASLEKTFAKDWSAARPYVIKK